jgi:hypothetical protein
MRTVATRTQHPGWQCPSKALGPPAVGLSNRYCSQIITTAPRSHICWAGSHQLTPCPSRRRVQQCDVPCLASQRSSPRTYPRPVQPQRRKSAAIPGAPKGGIPTLATSRLAGNAVRAARVPFATNTLRHTCAAVRSWPLSLRPMVLRSSATHAWSPVTPAGIQETGAPPVPKLCNSRCVARCLP